jgi:hypothetical protein
MKKTKKRKVKDLVKLVKIEKQIRDLYMQQREIDDEWCANVLLNGSTVVYAKENEQNTNNKNRKGVHN